jgi:hypothetical protein
MKWPAIGFWALLSELMAHVLSLSWGFGMLVVGFVWVAGLMRATSVKAYSAHQRLDALVPVVASTQSTANGALQKTGGTVSGSLAVNVNHSVGGALTANTIDGLGGGAIENSGGMHINGNSMVVDVDTSTTTLHVNGTKLNMLQSTNGGFPFSTSVAWGSGTVNAINSLWSALKLAGVISN